MGGASNPTEANVVGSQKPRNVRKGPYLAEWLNGSV